MSNRLTVQPDDCNAQWVPNQQIPNCTPGVPINGKAVTIPTTWTVPGTTGAGGGQGCYPSVLYPQPGTLVPYNPYEPVNWQEVLGKLAPQPIPKVWTGPKDDISVDAKPTNPKDALGTSRIPMDLVSAVAIAEEALAMVEGMLKYGKFNYRAVGVRSSIYAGAVLRHIAKWYNGEDRDAKTGVHHLGSARACLGVLLDAEAQGKLTDDRPPANPEITAILDAFEARVKHLQELFKDHNPKHYTINDAV